MKPQKLIERENIVDKALLQKALPKRVRHMANEEMVETINQILWEPEYAETYRENLLSYMSVLEDPGLKTKNYIQAIKYCTHKLAGATNVDAWVRTFPERYQRLLEEGKDMDVISAHVASWNRSKVVTEILKQAVIPVWLLNADVFQEAINVQAQIMRTAKSEKVRSDAANSLLNHLKQPETTKFQLDLGSKSSQELTALREAIEEHSKMQRQAIQVGNVSAKDIAESTLVEKEDDEEDR